MWRSAIIRRRHRLSWRSPALSRPAAAVLGWRRWAVPGSNRGPPACKATPGLIDDPPEVAVSGFAARVAACCVEIAGDGSEDRSAAAWALCGRWEPTLNRPRRNPRGGEVASGRPYSDQMPCMHLRDRSVD